MFYGYFSKSIMKKSFYESMFYWQILPCYKHLSPIQYFGSRFATCTWCRVNPLVWTIDIKQSANHGLKLKIWAYLKIIWLREKLKKKWWFYGFFSTRRVGKTSVLVYLLHDLCLFLISHCHRVTRTAWSCFEELPLEVNVCYSKLNS